MLQRVKVWEGPVRVLHWVHFLCVFVLAVTGFYIAMPFIDADDITATYLMATVRFIHFSAAFVLTVAFLARGYWFFGGNRYEDWHAWLPIGRERWRAFGRMLGYYLFFRRQRPAYIGVNPIAGLAYLALGVVIAIQIVTGFSLFSLPFPQGTLKDVIGWLVAHVGAQPIRLIHHFVTWVFISFFIGHIYLAVLDDIEERSGGTVSIISGEKFVPAAERDK